MVNLLCYLRRTKLNAQDDRQFYQQPRIVKHVDDRFLAQVERLTCLPALRPDALCLQRLLRRRCDCLLGQSCGRPLFHECLSAC